MGPLDPISPKKQVWNLYENLSPAESPQVQVSSVWINYNGNIQAKVSLIERKKKKRNEKNLTIHVYKIHITTCWAGNYKLETCEVALYWPIDRIFNTSSWNWAIFIEYLRMGRWAPALGPWVRGSLLLPARGLSCGPSLQCREVEKELTQCPCPPSQSHKANAKQMSSKGGKMKWKAHLGFIELKTKSQEKLGLWWAQSLPLMHFFFTVHLQIGFQVFKQAAGDRREMWERRVYDRAMGLSQAAKACRIWQPRSPLPTLEIPHSPGYPSFILHSLAYTSLIPYSLPHLFLILLPSLNYQTIPSTLPQCLTLCMMLRYIQASIWTHCVFIMSSPFI